MDAVADSVGGVVLSTVTVIVSEAELPAASFAMAIRMCGPSETASVDHEMLYGEEVSVPREIEPSRNSTLVTPMLSVAVAEIFTVPPIIALSAGSVIVTVGESLSVTVITYDPVDGSLAVLPAASFAAI